MQCDFCKSKATVFFTQIVDGQTKKSALCDKCAIEHGITDPEGFLVGHMQAPDQDLDSSSDPLELYEKELLKKQSDLVKQLGKQLVCTNCGFTVEDLTKTGRLGCSMCYQVFHSEIERHLEGMHVGLQHKGRVPEGMLEVFEKNESLEKFQKELELAISKEEFEKAAVLRDKINLLKESIEKTGTGNEAPSC